MENQNKKPRILKGVVVSDKMQKTAIVSVSRLNKHPKYKKYYKVTRRFKVHDEKNEYHIGDKVMIQETRPMSKEKRWRVLSKF
jgi:small subunit ribosomal protein S17